MKIRNNTIANLSFMARGNGGELMIPAGAAITLDDAIWKKHYSIACEAAIKAENLTIEIKPDLTESEEAEVKLAAIHAAEELLAERDAEEAAKAEEDGTGSIPQPKVVTPSA